MSTSSKTAAIVCPECGLPFSPGAPLGGLCPRCLMAAAVANLSTVDHPALGRFGDLGATPDIEHLNSALPQYEFAELLGRGGAGWVFRARQRSLDRPVAIKLLHGRASGIADAAQRFEREAQLLARLKHPRIVTVYDYGSIDIGPYLVMEFVPGPSLRDVLHGPRLNPAAAVRIADQIGEAVEYAHAMGVLHRDLKPENVLFETSSNSGGLKVVDFGISRLIGDTEPGFHLTQTGFVVGTPFYAAPEQMTPTKAIDARADIFSLGVMLYEMLTGQLPRGRFERPSKLASVPAALDAVAMRCLESDPERRYRDAAAVRRALHLALTGAVNWRRVAAWCAAAAFGALVAWTAITWSGSETINTAHFKQPPNADKEPATVPEPLARPAATSPLPETESRSNVDAPPQIAAPPHVAELQPGQIPPPAAAKAAPAPQTIPAPREDSYFDVTGVAVYGVTPIALEIRIDGRQTYDAFDLREGASLVWVVQTDGAHRIDIPFTLPKGKRDFTIADRLTLDFHDRWPIEVFVAERWYAPEQGSRRLSNSVRVESREIRRGPAPQIESTEERAIIRGETGPRGRR